MKQELYKGIFWIKNLNDISANDTCYRLACDENGNIKDKCDYRDDVLGKSGGNYNHEKFWATLPSKVTENKEFDYYPRGRVEINNGKAIIFITQDLADYPKEVIDFIKEKFNLKVENGINKISVSFDGSNHYKSKMM